jgi:hypothetical protein
LFSRILYWRVSVIERAPQYQKGLLKMIEDSILNDIFSRYRIIADHTIFIEEIKKLNELLKNNNNHISISDETMQILNGIKKDGKYDVISERAYKTIKSMVEDNTLKKRGDKSSTQMEETQRIFWMYNRFKLKYNICIITNNRELALDLLKYRYASSVDQEYEFKCLKFDNISNKLSSWDDEIIYNSESDGIVKPAVKIKQDQEQNFPDKNKSQKIVCSIPRCKNVDDIDDNIYEFIIKKGLEYFCDKCAKEIKSLNNNDLSVIAHLSVGTSKNKENINEHNNLVEKATNALMCAINFDKKWQNKDNNIISLSEKFINSILDASFEGNSERNTNKSLLHINESRQNELDLLQDDTIKTIQHEKMQEEVFVSSKPAFNSQKLIELVQHLLMKVAAVDEALIDDEFRHVLDSHWLEIGGSVTQYLEKTTRQLDATCTTLKEEIDVFPKEIAEQSIRINELTNEKERLEELRKTIQKEHDNLTEREDILRNHLKHLNKLQEHYQALKKINDGLAPETFSILKKQEVELDNLWKLLNQVNDHLQNQQQILFDQLTADSRIAEAIKMDEQANLFLDKHQLAKVSTEIGKIQNALKKIESNLNDIVRQRDEGSLTVKRRLS